MHKNWSDSAWEEYIAWQTKDIKLLRINQLIRDAERDPFRGIGKPEPLKYGKSGSFSRRIDEANRLVYEVSDNQIIVKSCKGTIRIDSAAKEMGM